MKALVLALLLCGCAGSSAPIADARIAVAKAGDALNRVRPLLVAICSQPQPPKECDAAIEGFNDVASAYTVVNDSLGAVP